MRTIQGAAVSCAVLLLAESTAFAERLRGFLWEASPSAIVVDGESVRMAPDTKIERPNQKDITARDLRVGWEVEVDARQEGSAWVARQVKVKDAFYYVRVIEIPTPRWTSYDVKRFGVKALPGTRMTVTERACTAPIWYTPD
jgi:Protein of unknown function (DUF3604)/Domain of unknown function (DUF5666)